MEFMASDAGLQTLMFSGLQVWVWVWVRGWVWVWVWDWVWGSQHTLHTPNPTPQSPNQSSQVNGSDKMLLGFEQLIPELPHLLVAYHGLRNVLFGDEWPGEVLLCQNHPKWCSLIMKGEALLHERIWTILIGAMPTLLLPQKHTDPRPRKILTCGDNPEREPQPLQTPRGSQG